MQTIRHTIEINAPKEKVWHAMLDDATYREWTTVFHPGSYYKGSWEEGAKMLFLGPGEDGKDSGMVSRIKEVRPHEFVSIEHLGIVADGVEDTESEQAKEWAPAYENYTFIDKDGGTEVVVEMEIADSQSVEANKEMFEELWPRALRLLKEIAER